MNLVDKISSYNIVTNLIPGVVELESLRATDLPLVSSKDLPTWLVLAYILGLLSSRVGSLIAGPAIRKFLRPKQNSYKDFIDACRIDQKIEILQETNNGYRTFIGCCICYFLITALFYAMEMLGLDNRTKVAIGVAVAMALFTFSYIKQLRFISDRVNIVSRDFKSTI